MNKSWEKTLLNVLKMPNDLNRLYCPVCKKNNIDYTYIKINEDNIGFLIVWCDFCFTGIKISRVEVIEGYKSLTYSQYCKKDILSKIKFIN